MIFAFYLTCISRFYEIRYWLTHLLNSVNLHYVKYVNVLKKEIAEVRNGPFVCSSIRFTPESEIRQQMSWFEFKLSGKMMWVSELTILFCPNKLRLTPAHSKRYVHKHCLR